MSLAPSTLRCDFCSKSLHEVFHIVAGVTACICDECLDLSAEVLRQAREKAGPILQAPPAAHVVVTQGSAGASA